MINEFRVNSKIKIGNDNPCFIIAEAGVNHDGSVSKAKELVDLGFKNVDDLRKCKNIKEILNDKQLLGLKFYVN